MITKVNLQNFKCFKDESIALSPFNLLTGLNGMGKSTFTQALLLLRQNYELGLLESGKGLALNGELVVIGNAKDLLYQYFESREISIGFETSNRMRATWTWDAKTESDNLPFLRKKVTNPKIYKIALFGSDFHYLNAERIGPRPYFETSSYQVISQNQIGLKGEFSADYLAKFQNRRIDIDALKHPDSNGMTLYEQVNAWLGEIRPKSRISISTNLDMNLVGLNYQFLDGTDPGNIFRSINVGFGLSFLLPVLVAVLASKPGTLLILENPEAHLHPRGQSQIGKLLALASANGVQVILETHSDHVLNGVRVAVKEKKIKENDVNILFFTGDVIENKFQHFILKPKINSDGRIDEWPEGFFDEWDRQLTNLL